MTEEQKTILRDAGIFAFKLWLDGIKDFVLAVVGLGAALFDMVSGHKEGLLFYRVMRVGKQVDAALDVYGAYREPALTPTDAKARDVDA